MKATFVELPPFERFRKDYLNDDTFRALQQELMHSPLAGDVIIGTGYANSAFPIPPEARVNEAERGLSTTGGMAAHNFGCSRSTTKMSWQI